MFLLILKCVHYNINNYKIDKMKVVNLIYNIDNNHSILICLFIIYIYILNTFSQADNLNSYVMHLRLFLLF